MYFCGEKNSQRIREWEYSILSFSYSSKEWEYSILLILRRIFLRIEWRMQRMQRTTRVKIVIHTCIYMNPLGEMGRFHVKKSNPGKSLETNHDHQAVWPPAPGKDTPLSVQIRPSPLSTMVVSRMQTAPAAGTGSSAVLAKLMEKL